jgi:hypothetical protein
MKETRKQKINRRAGHASDRLGDPIRAAIDRGDLVITPGAPTEEARELASLMSGREYCPRCSSGPRQVADVTECPDCGYRWSGPPLRP